MASAPATPPRVCTTLVVEVTKATLAGVKIAATCASALTSSSQVDPSAAAQAPDQPSSQNPAAGSAVKVT